MLPRDHKRLRLRRPQTLRQRALVVLVLVVVRSANCFRGFSGVSASGAACGCSRYELKPPFLLDNTTGEVWVYDEHTKHFGMVEVERSPVAKSVLNLIGAKVALDLRHSLKRTASS